MDLSYLNARVRAWKGRLLSKGGYEALLRAKDAAACLNELRGTGYGPYIDIASVSEGAPEDIIGFALRMDISGTFALLWKAAPEEARPLLRAVLLFWEVYNLKTVVRGIARGVKREDIINLLVPAGGLDRGALKELAHAKDIHDLIRMLKSWGSPYAKVLGSGLDTYVRHHSIMDMETALDTFANTSVFSELRGRDEDTGLVRDLLALRIDIKNILTLFKAVGEGLPPAMLKRFFIQGGSELSFKNFLELAASSDRETLLRTLVPLLRKRDLQEALEAADPEEVDMVEEMLEDVVRRRYMRLSLVNPLGMAVVIAYIYSKIREIKNLRMIARGKRFMMPADELRRFLILPL